MKIPVLCSSTPYIISLVAIVDAKRGIQEHNKNKVTPLQRIFPLSSDMCRREFLSQNVNFVIVVTVSFPSMNVSHCFIHNIKWEVVPQLLSTKLCCPLFGWDLTSMSFAQ